MSLLPRLLPRLPAIAWLCLVTLGGAKAADAEVKIVQTPRGQTIFLHEQPLAHIAASDIEGLKPTLTSAKEGGWHRVEVRWPLEEAVQVDEVAVAFDLEMEPDSHWMPHLAPEPGFVAAQHSFRSPAIIVAQGRRTLAIVPDLEKVGSNPRNPWFLDLDALAGRAEVGLSLTDVIGHVGFKKRPGMILEPGGAAISFFVTAWEDDAQSPNPFAKVTQFLWNRHGRRMAEAGEPLAVPLDTYVRHTYQWAFEAWEPFVWQEFEIDGKRVGAPQFIVNVSQSPNFTGPWHQREFLSIWNQAWFSSLRSASGLRRWADRVGDEELREKADLTKELALAAPSKEGIFPSVIRVPNRQVEVDGQTVTRPAGWEEATWTNSNRSPHNHGISADWYHVLDASWTALLMLDWHAELDADPRLLEKATAYADKLLKLQREDGFFPGWLHPDTLEPGPVMNRTPESSMSVTFLLKLAELTGRDQYRQAALRAMDAVIADVIPAGRWEDFETYWSCNPFRNDRVGEPIERNGLYKQNNFSIFWTAEALLAAHEAAGDPKYLAWGRRVLDELSMHQQVWQPPFIYIPAFGGFGVMNYDGEWNDARQSLFAELYLDYYRATGDEELFERGAAALRASFVMMYCPENDHVRGQYEKAHPFFGPEDYGFTMENYAHGGHANPEGVGIGPFTIYDWGNGAASEARNRIRDHYGDVFIDSERGKAFGIDAIRIEPTDTGWQIHDRANTPRQVRIMFDTGETRDIELNGSAEIERPVP